MAKEVKNKDAENAAASAPAAENGSAPAAAAAPAVKKTAHMRKIVLEDGTEMTRKDYILSLVSKGLSRSEITANIKAIPVERGGDPDFRYQIVFQATKDLDPAQYPKLLGGAKKAAPAAEAPAQS
jgi:hypothetical protein